MARAQQVASFFGVDDQDDLLDLIKNAPVPAPAPPNIPGGVESEQVPVGHGAAAMQPESDDSEWEYTQDHDDSQASTEPPTKQDAEV